MAKDLYTVMSLEFQVYFYFSVMCLGLYLIGVLRGNFDFCNAVKVYKHFTILAKPHIALFKSVAD